MRHWSVVRKLRTFGGAPFAAEGLLLLPEHPELPEGTKFSVQTALRIESLNLDALRLAG